MTDAEGYVCVLTNETTADTRTRRYRDYFAGARDAGPGRYYVDHAILGMVSGRLVFNVAKARISDGIFNGIVAISVNIADLTYTWGHVIGVKPTQRLSLFRTDGRVIARSWQPAFPANDIVAARRAATVWQSVPEGAGIRNSQTDGTKRVGAWRTLADWGVVITSSVDETEVLRPWRRAMFIYGTLAALASAVSATLAWSLLRGQRLLARTVMQRTNALRASEDRLRLFIDGAPAGIALFDSKMRYLAVSRRYLQDCRLPFSKVEDLVGRSHFDVSTVPTHWREIYRRALAGETLSGDNDIFTYPDGHVDWVCWDVAPWYELDSAVGGAVLFYEVVTARKQAEMILSRGKEELEELVTERTRELAQTQAQLAHAQRLEALGQLAGGIAHDFNNILQAVQGAAVLTERRPADQDRVRSLARMIIETVRRGSAVTRRLLAFSRQSDLQAEPLAARALLEGMQEILACTLGAGTTVKVETKTGLPLLLADKSQLETVLVNLATNARDAMPHGGTLTFAAIAEIMTDISQHGYPASLQQGSYVRLSVCDTGSGMAPEVLERASEPFFTTKKIGAGTGLGLAMARGFAEQSGGGFGITSAPGHGTAVHLWFPVAEHSILPAVPAIQHRMPVATPLRMRARLLVVDDDAAVCQILALGMEAEGYTVLTAVDGTDALRILDTGEEIDLIITDYSMPNMDGVTLIKEAHVRRPMLAAIILTGFTENAAEMSVIGKINQGFTLLRKPISSTHLADCIDRLLSVKNDNHASTGAYS